MNKKITAQIGSVKKAAQEFIDTWHQTESGHTSKTAIEKISFKDQALLFKTLTPKRFEILEYIHSQDGISIRAVAKALKRDYSNVYQDVKLLHQLGLIIKDDESGKCYVPWDIIVTEIRLPVIKKGKNTRYKLKSTTTRVSNG